MGLLANFGKLNFVYIFLIIFVFFTYGEKHKNHTKTLNKNLLSKITSQTQFTKNMISKFTIQIASKNIFTIKDIQIYYEIASKNIFTIKDIKRYLNYSQITR